MNLLANLAAPGVIRLKLLVGCFDRTAIFAALAELKASAAEIETEIDSIGSRPSVQSGRWQRR